MKILIIFLIFFNFIYATSLTLNSNIKSNIDILSSNLSIFLDEKEISEKSIKNFLQLYYQNYKKIIAFEILKNNSYIYSSYKENYSMYFLKKQEIPLKYKENKNFYKKSILNHKKEEIGTLIVYFENELNLTVEELLYLQKKRVLKVQNDPNLLPYNFYEDGIAKGYAIDYINLIANKLALEVEYISGPTWNDFLNMLENNQLDLMINVLKSKQREERFLFSSKAFTDLEPAMVTRIENEDVFTFKELEGKTMALVKGYHSYDRVKKQYPKINIYPTNNTLEMLQAVSTKKADAAYALKEVLEYTINKNLLTNLKVLKNLDDKTLGFYFAFNKENTILKNIIAKAEKLITTEEKKELERKWFYKLQEIKKTSKNYLFNEAEKAYLAKKEVIYTCVDPDYLPFEQVSKSGEYRGIIAEILENLSKKTSIKFELYSSKSFIDSINLVKEKKCDIVPFAAKTNSREKYLNFTQAYYKFSNVIVTKNNQLFIDSLEEIKDKKIGMIKNYAVVELFKNKYPNLQIVEVNNNQEGLDKIVNNEIYALVSSLPSIAFTLQKYNYPNLKIVGKASIDSLARFAVRDDEKILLDILNKALNSLKNEEKEAIVNRWITVVKEERLDTKLLIQIASSIFVIAIIIILLVIYRSNRYLNILNKELEKLSVTDKLTGINNRAKLDSILDKELKITKRYKEPLSIIILDIDHFKKINDKYGHICGDEILKEFATILKSNIRETDRVGRWGGEEFLIILPHTNENEATILAEHLRETIEDFSFYKNIKVTASFGVYECTVFNDIQCIENVDKALYSAKNSNRNCVRTHSSLNS
ncbi:diguanylate cyclase [Malaciobacter mytili]|uniref:transporter substrate-binding domain-containing diguanylate cyclase n=1 Tax=Malaciobacter mytili TaxID=603050 RepID=UPI00100BCECD|nr:transporter substrate-binding domain-containing protein [Malaciobacter mytili]RXI48850.1 hypothetical protein CRU99_00320 [Malaciobacter mytili]